MALNLIKVPNVTLVISAMTRNSASTEELDKGEQHAERSRGGQLILGCCTAGIVPAIDEVQKEGNAGLKARLEGTGQKHTGSMNHEINATTNGTAQLAQGGHDSSNLCIKKRHEVFANKTPPGGAHANGTKLGGVRGIFVKGHESIGSKALN